MEIYKLGGIIIKKRIPNLGFIENFKRAYWPIAPLIIDSETNHLIINGDKEKIDFGVPKRIELVNTRSSPLFRFVMISIIFAFYFGLIALADRLVPIKYWPLYESPTGYYIIGIILLILSIIISGKAEQMVKVVYTEDGIEKEVYLSPSKYLGMENIQLEKTAYSALTIGDKNTTTSAKLYENLQKYYQ